MTHPAHVVVIGGGITGLAAAHALVQGDDAPAVTVLERDGRLGGKVQATAFAGLPSVECGADMFLARTPAAVELAGALGLGDELVAPAGLPAFVWSGGRLHPLPEGLVLGAPVALWPMARSGLLSWRGKARAALEPLVPRRDAQDSLGAAVRHRFGDEVLERLVGPLIGGINAGDPDRLSLQGVAPQLSEAMAAHRSLLVGLRAQVRSPRPAGNRPPASPFLAPRTGVSTLIHRLIETVAGAGATLRPAAPVTALAPLAGGRWLLDTIGGPVEADAVVAAAPAPAVADLLAELSPEAAESLRKIRYASVAMVTLALAEADVAHSLVGSGYLVPRHEQRTITACSWASSKWEQWYLPGQVLLRVSAGRDGDERALELDDAELTDAVLRDLERHVGLRGAPVAVRVTRWGRSLPQYAPGHLQRIDDVVAALAGSAPGIHLAGAAYKGLGLPACIAQGQAAARAVLATVGHG